MNDFTRWYRLRRYVRTIPFMLCFVLCLASCAAGRTTAQHRIAPARSASAASDPFAPVTALLQQGVVQYGLPGASLIVIQDGATIYEHHAGAFSAATVVPIASATKWTSGAIVMALVDQGTLTLDDTAAQYLPSFDTAEKRSITLRQLLSHSSGLPGQDVGCLARPTTTLAACVEQIAAAPLVAPPGTVFLYGGNSFQVAGRVAEVASGKPWQQLFAETLKTPLDLTALTYGRGANPWIGGGAASTLADYSRFVQMLLQQGSYNGRQVLSPGAVATMETSQVAGLPIGFSPAPEAEYGVATWLADDAADQSTHIFGAGAFGTQGWIDRTRNLAGVILTQGSLAELRAWEGQVVQAVRDAVDAPAAPLRAPTFLPLVGIG